jgi:hypothetical protein
MTHRSRTSSSRNGTVGYGKPPTRTQFRKGVSGNPGGRPRGMTAGRATALAIKEAYRLVTVREGDKVVTMPAIQCPCCAARSRSLPKAMVPPSVP